MAIKIMIDAGHGGFDNGASYNGRTEKNDNLNLALALGDALSELGYDVEFTRTTDVYDSPTRKAQIGNESGADYFISLHRNAAPYPNKYNGVETRSGRLWRLLKRQMRNGVVITCIIPEKNGAMQRIMICV